MKRRKDKPAKERTMRDVLKNAVPDMAPDVSGNFDGGAKNAPLTDDEIIFSEEFAAQIKAYNENIHNLDPMFTSVIPTDKFLVRVKLRNLERDANGLIKPYYEFAPVHGKNGMTMTMMTSPWPFSNEAVVVAVPIQDYLKGKIEPGAEIVMNKKVVKAEVVGNGEGRLSVPGFFKHPRIDGPSSPSIDPEHRNYGYIMVDFTAIDVILPKE